MRAELLVVEQGNAKGCNLGVVWITIFRLKMRCGLVFW